MKRVLTVAEILAQPRPKGVARVLINGIETSVPVEPKSARVVICPTCHEGIEYTALVDCRRYRETVELPNDGVYGRFELGPYLEWTIWHAGHMKLRQ